MAQETALRRGYLREDFRLFHLKDAAMEQVDWHYHSFHKVLVLLSGHASYTAPNSPQGMGRTCWATLFCFNFSFPSPGSWKHILGCTQLPPPVTRRLSPF